MRKLLGAVLIAMSLVALPGAPAGAAAPCGHPVNQANYKFSWAFTTCGYSAGVKADLNFGSGQYNLTNPAAAVQAVQVNVTNSPNYMYFGYQRGTYQGQNDCYVVGGYNGNFFNSGIKCNANPSTPTLQLQSSSPYSQVLYAYLNGNQVGGSYTIGTNVYSLILTGSIRINGSNSDTSQVVRYNQQAYLPYGSTSLSQWGTKSHCYLDSPSSFGQNQFPSSHSSAIGSGAGGYSGCDSANSYSAASTYGVNGTW